MAKHSFIASYSFTSTDELMSQLRGVNLVTQEKIFTDALSYAAAPIVEQARANLTSMGAVRTGALRKSMGFVIRRYLNAGKLVAYIGPRIMDFAANASMTRAATLTAKRPLRPGESKIVPARYAHLIEWGFRHISGLIVAPRPFLRAAFEAKIFVAEARLREGFLKALEKAFVRRSNSLERKVVKLAA